jgi:superkiller protein 3
MSICAAAESRYEEFESPKDLSHFALAKSDLARVQLASDDYTSAIESAETALQLSSDESADDLKPDERRKCRLSAHLSAGLAHYYEADMDEALAMFNAALDESDGNADVICLLAQVLWAKGGERERDVARAQLFDSIEKNPGHVQSIVLLGSIAVLDGDDETLEAVADDLKALRTSEAIDEAMKSKVGRILSVAAVLKASGEMAAEEIAEATSSIMLAPAQPRGWSELAKLSGDTNAADMALRTAKRAVPPAGKLDAVNLAKAYAGTGKVGDAQRAIVVTPWISDGWDQLHSLISPKTLF